MYQKKHMLRKQVNLDSYLKIVLQLLPLNSTEKLDCQKHRYISSFEGLIRQISLRVTQS